MRIHRFPQARLQREALGKAAIKKAEEINAVNYGISDLARVESVSNAETKETKERASEEVPTKEKARTTKKKA